MCSCAHLVAYPTSPSTAWVAIQELHVNQRNGDHLGMPGGCVYLESSVFTP